MVGLLVALENAAAASRVFTAWTADICGESLRHGYYVARPHAISQQLAQIDDG